MMAKNMIAFLVNKTEIAADLLYIITLWYINVFFEGTLKWLARKNNYDLRDMKHMLKLSKF